MGTDGFAGHKRPAIRTATGISGALLLAACGGGGGISSPGTAAPPTASPAPTPTPTPAPVPSPTPTPAPAPTTSAEDQASRTAVSIKADAAYAKGLAGRGVTVAVIDTGIVLASSEFAGRISPDSKSFDSTIARCATCAPETVHFSLDDVTGHGTETAAIALAARDGLGMHGVASEATLLALKIAAPDLEGVTATSTIRESANANAGLIAPALTYAVDHGAFVVSLSLNGTAGGQIAADQKAAMDYAARNDRLLVESVSNDIGDQSAGLGTIARNLVGSGGENRGWFLFGIRVNPDLSAPAGNGLPGDLADRTLAVMAVEVQTVGTDGQPVTVTGNSFAAPAIAGAAVLLKQYWPQLGGKAIAQILLDTATDLGPAGVDQQFGAGLLNLDKALQAQAPAASFAAAQTVLARYASLTVSAPFGGADLARRLSGTVGTMTVVDRYGRDYRMTTASGIRARGSGLLAGSMLPLADPVWLGQTQADARAGFASLGPVGPWQSVGSNRPATVAFSPGHGQTVMLAANVAVTAGDGIAGSALRGIASAPVGFSSDWAGAGWSAGLGSGRSFDRRSALDTFHVRTPLGLGFEITALRERGQALGMAGGSELGIVGARTRLATFTAERPVLGWQLAARATVGRTEIEGGSDLMRITGPVTSTAYAVHASRPALAGLVTLGLSSPLRAEHAPASLLVPVAYDLMTGALTSEQRAVDLAPTARELDFELGWSTALSRRSSLRLGVAHALDAGHAAGVTDTAGFFALILR